MGLVGGIQFTIVYTGDEMSAVDGRVEINLSEFNGEFKLVHHFRDQDNYQYIRLAGNEMQQGQIVESVDNVLDSGRIELEGWSTFRVTASGRHFYGYQNGNTILHTHSDEMEPGVTGFAIHGEGTIKIRLLEFRSL